MLNVIMFLFILQNVTRSKKSKCIILTYAKEEKEVKKKKKNWEELLSLPFYLQGQQCHHRLHLHYHDLITLVLVPQASINTTKYEKGFEGNKTYYLINPFKVLKPENIRIVWV